MTQLGINIFGIFEFLKNRKIKYEKIKVNKNK